MGRSRSRTFPELAGVSLWVFPQENRFRQALYDIVTHKFFDYFMFLLIMLNCVAMAYEYPAISKENLDGAILFWRFVACRASATQLSMTAMPRPKTCVCIFGDSLLSLFQIIIHVCCMICRIFLSSFTSA